MITTADKDRPGTISHGELAILGQVLKVNEDDTFTFATAEFGTIRLDSNQWAFSNEAPAGTLTPGWYIQKGEDAPWYVDADQNVHSFFLHGGEASKASFALTEELLHSLKPVQA